MKPINLKTPIKYEAIKKLRAGDEVLLSGTVFTARDMAYQFLVNETKGRVPAELKKKLKNAVIFHCGPVMRRIPAGKAGREKWIPVSAGPTTSKRMELYTPELVNKYGIKAILGKGGLLQNSHKAFVRHGCIYISVIGGAGALVADKIVAVKNVYKLNEFGMPEAIWELEVRDLPGTVTMDAHGKCLIYEIYKKSKKAGEKL